MGVSALVKIQRVSALVCSRSDSLIVDLAWYDPCRPLTQEAGYRVPLHPVQTSVQETPR